MKKILVGTDGSDGGQAAVAWAARFSQAIGAKVALAAVVEPHDDGDESTDRRATSALLEEEWAVPLRELDVDHEQLVLLGDPRTALLDAAEESGSDAVIVGTRGRGGFQGLGVGGVAHYLARHLPCPLIAVPRAGGPLFHGKVIAGADIAPANIPALEWAADVAARVDAQALALFAYSPLSDVMTHRMDNWHYPWEDKLYAHVQQAGTFEVVTAAGNAVEELVRIGRARDAALIVVGRRGRGSLHGLLLGRVPAQLLHHAGRPVAVIPH